MWYVYFIMSALKKEKMWGAGFSQASAGLHLGRGEGGQGPPLRAHQKAISGSKMQNFLGEHASDPTRDHVLVHTEKWPVNCVPWLFY